jgi:hypothetical protein
MRFSLHLTDILVNMTYTTVVYLSKSPWNERKHQGRKRNTAGCLVARKEYDDAEKVYAKVRTVPCARLTPDTHFRV